MCVYFRPSHHHEVAARESAPSNGYPLGSRFFRSKRLPKAKVGYSWLMQQAHPERASFKREVPGDPGTLWLEKQTRLKQTITCC